MDDAKSADEKDAPTALESGRTMQGLGPSSSSTARTVAVELPPPNEIPEAARYEVGKQLGAGGMGVVHLELDRRIGRDVAIKRLHGKLGAHPHSVARFLREARVQGQLEHPAIVPVYDLGSDDDGSPYFTMKRVRGRSLREVINKKRERDPEAREHYSRRRLLSAFSQVCLAVDYAHSHGVVHRDLKPGNIMLGGYGEVYVIDWGLARPIGVADESAEEPIRLGPEDDNAKTEDGALLGTPGYMAPEQLLNNSIDGRADVWALGAILFEILTNHHLVPRTTTPQMMSDTLDGPEARPSARGFGDVPPELEDLCVRATHPDPELRVASAREISDAIERYLDGDRDLTARKAKAEAHAARAEEAAHAALESEDESERKLVAQEAGRALALDPTHVGARRTLLSLFTRPPRTMPKQARESFDKAMEQRHARLARASAIPMLLYMPLVLALALADLRETWPVAVTVVVFVVYLGLCARGMLRPRADTYIPFFTALVAALGFICMGRLTGPYLALPLFAAVNGLIASMNPGRVPRWWCVAVGVLPIVAAAGIEESGWLAATTTYEGGRLILTPQLLDFGRFPVLPFLFVIHLLQIAFTTTMLGRLSAQSREVERSLHVHRWQLEQLVPE